MAEVENKLHWTQRIALIRHNLHAASRSGDFTFFKTLQAAGFMEGTNHVSALNALLGDDADTLMTAMDNLNAGLAYAHQDAFKNVYEAVKLALSSDGEDRKSEARCKLFVDTSMQRNIADLAIDKATSSAINLINQQNAEVQEVATNVWVTGITIIADAIEVTLSQLTALEYTIDDFIRMEESWITVKASVIFAITGMKGVFELMDPMQPSSTKVSPRNSSIASAGASVFRRLSNAFAPSLPSSRTSSVASVGAPPMSGPFGNAAPTLGAPVYRTPNFRSGGGKSAPFATQGAQGWQHKLDTIPPTPFDDDTDPFDTTKVPPPLPPVPVLEEQETPVADVPVNPLEEDARATTVVMIVQMPASISRRLFIQWLPDVPTEPTGTLVLTSPEGRFVDIRILKSFPSVLSSRDDASNTRESLQRTDQDRLMTPSDDLKSEDIDWAFAGWNHTVSIDRPVFDVKELDAAIHQVELFAKRHISIDDRRGSRTVQSTWMHSIDSRSRDAKTVADRADMIIFPLVDMALEKSSMINPATGLDTKYIEAWQDDEISDAESGSAVVFELDAKTTNAQGMFIKLGRYMAGVARDDNFYLRTWTQTTEWNAVARLGNAIFPSDVAVKGRLQLGQSFTVKDESSREWNWIVVEAESA
ncbi:hypothetical protein MRB53_040267 [Persea americana]|nr:hypothetical protein MRB53_040267 [Persea americana]